MPHIRTQPETVKLELETSMARGTDRWFNWNGTAHVCNSEASPRCGNEVQNIPPHPLTGRQWGDYGLTKAGMNTESLVHLLINRAVFSASPARNELNSRAVLLCPDPSTTTIQVQRHMAPAWPWEHVHVVHSKQEFRTITYHLISLRLSWHCRINNVSRVSRRVKAITKTKLSMANSSIITRI